MIAMKSAPFYRAFYEKASIAEEDVAAEKRTPTTIAMIPHDVSSVLDVGCGDGSLLRSVDSANLKVGVDISYTALSLVTSGFKILASSEILPFRENEFDLVMSTEVLEHLPDWGFEASCSEIQRVAKRYVLISVPFHEDLARKQARCSRCGHVYHIHLHLRSFDLSSLEGVFPSYQLKEYRFSGSLEKTYPSWLLAIRRNYGHRWEWDKAALCPQCGHKEGQPPRRSIISVATSLAGTLVGKRYPKWISALYEEK
jgi:ubiquinone/menaquinone biosynthesis C-methylase UbiE